MFNLHRIAINHFVDELQTAYHRIYSRVDPEIGNMAAWTGRLALELIANSDALYHNLEHTIMVTLAGQSILEGKQISEGGILSVDWLNYSIALVCHDIGYVRGVCSRDGNGEYATGIGDEVITQPNGGTDIAMTPYHVDRSKLFVRERFGKKTIGDTGILVDVERIVSYIEMTRFPPPKGKAYEDTRGLGGLTRAADFIGQLGDPNYLRKTPALFYEFEESDANKKLGYKRPLDLRRGYAKFFWDVVNPYIQDALGYLRVTQDGKQWIASLYSHVFTAEHSEE